MRAIVVLVLIVVGLQSAVPADALVRSDDGMGEQVRLQGTVPADALAPSDGVVAEPVRLQVVLGQDGEPQGEDGDPEEAAAAAQMWIKCHRRHEEPLVRNEMCRESNDWNHSSLSLFFDIYIDWWASVDLEWTISDSEGPFVYGHCLSPPGIFARCSVGALRNWYEPGTMTLKVEHDVVCPSPPTSCYWGLDARFRT